MLFQISAGIAAFCGIKILLSQYHGRYARRNVYAIASFIFAVQALRFWL
jgi:hypothetical protein